MASGDLERALIEKIPLSGYCAIVNAINRLRARPIRISPLREDGLHVARDGVEEIHLARRGRHKRYKRGIRRGIDGLARQYHLHTIEIRPGGVFIDCGANIGELGLWARARGLDYIPFEPEALEADCNDLNNFGGERGTRRCALWKEDTTLTFFSKPETADSSVFDMGTDHPGTAMPAVALDGAVDVSGYEGTRILKVEAEGAEPEVLEGAVRTIGEMDYVAIDCGYERGIEQRHTFVETNRFLSDRGFRPVQASFHRVTMLYENTRR